MEGASAAGSLAEAVTAIRENPRAFWAMLPAGRITEETVERLGTLLEPDGIIIGDKTREALAMAAIPSTRMTSAQKS